MEINKNVIDIIDKLNKNGFESYIVGGCVRDTLINREPKDWDITTIARPDEILKIFPESRYENTFGTIIIPIKDKDDKLIEQIEVTTYRSEQGYSDRRHPDEIRFENEIDRDLERRDFTINALAINLYEISDKYSSHIQTFDNYNILDFFGGIKDIKNKIIRSVGEPADRFKEDALRMMRAIRFACELEFNIEEKTLRGITKLAGNIKFISNERKRDELIKILSSNKAAEGIELLQTTKLLQYIIPELEEGVKTPQTRHHVHPVFKHLTLSLKNCPNPNWQVRLATLMHDVGKPKTLKMVNGETTFYNHEYAGAKITYKVMTRLKFSNKDIERVTNLVKNHMFYYDVGEVTESSVRRLIKKVGEENLKDLIDVRIGDRLGSGVAKAKPYRLRHLEYMMDKVRHDPISVKMLKINGNDLIQLLQIQPSPKIGTILDCLLAEIIEDPKLNTKEYLEEKAHELNKLNDNDLRAKAKEVIEEEREKEDQSIKNKHYVK